MITQVSNSLHQQLRTSFEESLPTLEGPIEHLRKAAFEKFTTLGLPTTKLEEWKNTSIQTVLEGDLESFITEDGSEANLNNAVTEIVLAKNAKMEHYYIQVAAEQSKYLNHTEVTQDKDSVYNNYNCTFPGAAFVRNNINVRMDAETVESHLYGICLTSAKQLVDNHTVVDHMKPHGESYEWYKNIIQEDSTVIFNGIIFVREDAQKTNAFQQNNNLLLSEGATIFTKPQLEIFADDVKCSHGCTIGQFNEEALFYLRSRGIGAEQARILMVHAFAFDVTERFKDEVVKNYVNNLIAEGLML